MDQVGAVSRRGIIAAIAGGAASTGRAAAAALPKAPPGKIWVCVDEAAWRSLVQAAVLVAALEPPDAD